MHESRPPLLETIHEDGVEAPPHVKTRNTRLEELLDFRVVERDGVVLSFVVLAVDRSTCAEHRGLATRSETAQIWTRDHPRHREMATSRLDGVKAPQYLKTRRSHRQ